MLSFWEILGIILIGLSVIGIIIGLIQLNNIQQENANDLAEWKRKIDNHNR